MSRSRILRLQAVLAGIFAAVALVGDAIPASAGACPDPYYWAETTGRTNKPNNCFGGTGFRCYKAIAGTYFFQLKDSGCDPLTAPAGCVVQLRVPLSIPGVQDMVEEDGLFGSPTPVIYWWEGESTAPACPGTQTDCGQEAICGTGGFGGLINRDSIDTWVERPGITCGNAREQAGTYSLRVMVCRVASECRVDTTVDGMMWETLLPEDIGCPEDPPEDKCNGDNRCEECLEGGVGVGGDGPGVGPGQDGGDNGDGAFLYYAAGGAGHPQFPGTAAWNVALGRYWSHDYAMRIVEEPDETHVWLITKFATFREWSNPDGLGVYQTVSPASEYRTLTWLGTGLGWELAELDGTVHAFDAAGLWLSTTDRNGNAKTATYTAGELTSIAFPDGTREDFTYHPSGKLASITKVGVDNLASRTWSYGWTGDDLTRVDRPDGTAILYHYDEPAVPGYLTRIELEGSDDASIRVLRGYEYDAEGNVTKTWKGDVSSSGAEAVEVWSLAYDDPEEPTVTTVTPPVGDPITYTLDRDPVSSNVRVLSISGDCPTCGLGPNSHLFYDDPAHPLLPTRTVDGRGTTTVLSYSTFGQVTSRTEAMGDPEERTTTWTYDATYPTLVTSMEQPSVAGGASTRTTDFTLDGSGNVTDRTISGVEAGSAFSLTTTTTYNAAGRPLTIDPAGHGMDDETTFTYDPARGSLIAASRIDPLIGATTFGHDAFNRRTSVTDPNGVATTTAFDPLDRVTEVRQEGASPPTDDLVTTRTYTVFGDLLRTTLPRGNVVEYGYDPAGRLVSVERKSDASTPGERVLYTLDAAGNRTLEELQRWDVGGGTWVTVGSTAYEYTNRCQVDRIVQAPGSTEEAATAFEYDCNGNLSAQWDANHDPDVDPPTTSYSYDPLDRLTSVSQPWAGGGNAATGYGFDVQDHLVSVTDAEGSPTTYTYSDRDLMTQEMSLVSGTTSHSYDEHGELVSTTDARGVTVTRAVDALDRLTFVNYPDDSLDTNYTYDAAPAVCAGASFPVGRVGAITRDGNAVEYCHDRFGRTTRDGELTYTHDGNGNRTAIGYPGGVVATYTRDFADREVSLTVTSPGGTEPVVSAATYLPSGPLSSLALGSGVTETRGFDDRYAPTAITLAGPVERTFSYTTDRVGNILEIVEQSGCTPGPLVLENQTLTTEELFVSCSTIEAGNDFRVESPGDVAFHALATIALKSGFSVGSGARFVAGSGSLPELSRRTFTYQAPQYFLTSADGPWGTLDWSYDRIGNRLSEARDGGAADLYQYQLNAGGGNTPVLDVVQLGVTGTRDYTWGAAGHLEEVAAGANVLDFGSDAEGRLSGVDRTAATEAAGFLYDGRSFLRTAQETAGGTRSVEPLYDSAGLVHALRRRPSVTDPEELVVFLYLAGRPVAQLAIDGAAVETWTYLATDHLGTPFLATGDSGELTWGGGFEPFGQDYQAGTSAGVLENGVYLRLPGQWQDGTWSDATSGAGIYYNVHRWYEVGTGRYTRKDPVGDVERRQDVPWYPRVGIERFSLYMYVDANPLAFIDPLGLVKFKGCTPDEQNQISHAFKEYCSKIAQDDFKHCIECEDPKLPGKLKRVCDADDRTVRCKDDRTGQCSAPEGQVGCAWSIPLGRTIRLCPDAWTPSCGPLGCTLMHEVTHQLGSPGEAKPEAVERCLGC